MAAVPAVILQLLLLHVPSMTSTAASATGGAASTRTVTITTDAARRDVDGNYIDAHDGMILHHQGSYFLYGEAYGNQTLATPYPWKGWPRLKVGLQHSHVAGQYPAIRPPELSVCSTAM